jgi:hypothetical protein
MIYEPNDPALGAILRLSSESEVRTAQHDIHSRRTPLNVNGRKCVDS